MKIFIDTNIFLDLILKRDGYKDAIIILNSCNQDIFKGFVADITLLNIDYIASKQIKNIKDFLKTINESFSIIGANNKTFKLALELNNNDLEDNVQYICSKSNDCDVIISNDNDFYKGDIKVLSSKEFVNEYI
ncbi:MAG: PIN domain-containing protein [Campylobacterota bacterium]|nr:PIN domain-containing protein [Campylobacterota bacterium]